jgi:hypothetical protein
MDGHTVTATTVTTAPDDGLGNTSESTTTTTVKGVLFAPEGATESVDARSPNVIGRASLYGAFPALDSDDRIDHDVACCSGAEFGHGTWQVVGGSRGWGPGLMVVPIDKAGAS